MVIGDRAIAVHSDDAVVEAAVAASAGKAFVEAQDEDDVVFLGGIAKLARLGAVDPQAVGGEARVDPLGRRVIPAGVIDCVIEPGGVAGEEGLAEGGQPGAPGAPLPESANRRPRRSAPGRNRLVELESGRRGWHRTWREGISPQPSSTARTRNWLAIAVGGVGDGFVNRKRATGDVGAHDIGQGQRRGCRVNMRRVEFFQLLKVIENGGELPLIAGDIVLAQFQARQSSAIARTASAERRVSAMGSPKVIIAGLSVASLARALQAQIRVASSSSVSRSAAIEHVGLVRRYTPIPRPLTPAS